MKDSPRAGLNFSAQSASLTDSLNSNPMNASSSKSSLTPSPANQQTLFRPSSTHCQTFPNVIASTKTALTKAVSSFSATTS
jgi:hypothetical protein